MNARRALVIRRFKDFFEHFTARHQSNHPHPSVSEHNLRTGPHWSGFTLFDEILQVDCQSIERPFAATSLSKGDVPDCLTLPIKSN